MENNDEILYGFKRSELPFFARAFFEEERIPDSDKRKFIREFYSFYVKDKETRRLAEGLYVYTISDDLNVLHYYGIGPDSMTDEELGHIQGYRIRCYKIEEIATKYYMLVSSYQSTTDIDNNLAYTRCIFNLDGNVL